MIAALRLAGVGVLLGVNVALGTWATLNMPRPTPAACHIGQTALPSGDAARFGDGTERVCTDGTWVKVSHYGN